MRERTTIRGIPFRAIMVQAILDGVKTETRRVIKPHPDDPGAFGTSPIWGHGIPTGNENKRLRDKFCVHAAFDVKGKREDRWLPCRYGVPGDRLYAREAVWVPPPITQKMLREGADTWPDFAYGDDNADEWRDLGFKKKPGMFMPRQACRVDDMVITAMRAEPLQHITEEAAIAEGAAYMPTFARAVELRQPEPHRAAFLWFFAQMHKVQITAAFPCVWVIQFKREAANV